MSRFERLIYWIEKKYNQHWSSRFFDVSSRGIKWMVKYFYAKCAATRSSRRIKTRTWEASNHPLLVLVASQSSIQPATAALRGYQEHIASRLSLFLSFSLSKWTFGIWKKVFQAFSSCVVNQWPKRLISIKKSEANFYKKSNSMYLFWHFWGIFIPNTSTLFTTCQVLSPYWVRLTRSILDPPVIGIRSVGFVYQGKTSRMFFPDKRRADSIFVIKNL